MWQALCRVDLLLLILLDLAIAVLLASCPKETSEICSLMSSVAPV